MVVEELNRLSNKIIGIAINIHIAQLLSYLKTLDKKLGLILNFAESRLAIKRVVNRL